VRRGDQTHRLIHLRDRLRARTQRRVFAMLALIDQPGFDTAEVARLDQLVGESDELRERLHPHGDLVRRRAWRTGQ